MYEDFSRMWFALCADGTLSVLGDHGDYAAADATAEDLGLDVIWLVCGNDAAQWADTINSKGESAIDDLIVRRIKHHQEMKDIVRSGAARKRENYKLHVLSETLGEIRKLKRKEGRNNG
jgi:hypothetical protein